MLADTVSIPCILPVPLNDIFPPFIIRTPALFTLTKGASTLAPPITKLSVASSCPIVYWAAPALKNLTSVSLPLAASNLTLVSPEAAFKSKTSTGVIPIPTLSSKIAVDVVLSVPSTSKL